MGEGTPQDPGSEKEVATVIDLTPEVVQFETVIDKEGRPDFSQHHSRKGLIDALRSYVEKAGRIEKGADGDFDHFVAKINKAFQTRDELLIKEITSELGIQEAVRNIIKIEKEGEQQRHDSGQAGPLNVGAIPPSEKTTKDRAGDLKKEAIAASKELQEAPASLNFDDIETRDGLVAAIKDYYKRSKDERPITTYATATSDGQPYTADQLIRFIDEAIDTGDFDSITTKHGLRKAARRALQSKLQSTTILNKRIEESKSKPWYKKLFS